MQEQAFNCVSVVRFLRHLLQHIGGKLLVVWDGLPAHRSKEIKGLLRETKGRLHLERLPGYAPDLNPDEGIWQYLKNVELANICCRSMAELRRQLGLAIERLCHKRDVIIGCFGLAGLDL